MTQGKAINNKRIAKNTMFLYFRMMVTMIISLYTSRVILQVLGVDDYGIYQAVGGIVGFLSFVNSAMSTGSSRFITFGLGEGNLEKLKRIFSTTMTCHIILATLIVLVAETAGLWFLHHKMVIPTDRLFATECVFHLSIVTAFFNLTQIPYNACIIAHEKMTVFAYVSIVDAIFRLLIVYMLLIGKMDKLILYAFLHMILQVSILTFYRFYTKSHFKEARFKIKLEKGIFRDIISFSGWSLFASSAIALNNQGILILLNMFFPPAVVTARSLSIQANMAIHHFVSNFQTAAVPQIVKRYASEDYDASKHLLLEMAKYSFYLMLLMAVPICFTAEHLLKLWLGIVPPYTVIFLQLIVIQSLIQAIDTSFYYAIYAKGQLKENALLSPSILFLSFPVVYFMFRMGYSPVVLSWATIISYFIIGFFIKPFLLIRIVNYTWHDIFSVFTPCVVVLLASLPFPFLLSIIIRTYHMPHFIEFILIAAICVFSVSCSCWFLGLSRKIRLKLSSMAKSKIAKII